MEMRVYLRIQVQVGVGISVQACWALAQPLGKGCMASVVGALGPGRL